MITELTPIPERGSYLIDTHTHYNSQGFDEDRDALIAAVFGEKRLQKGFAEGLEAELAAHIPANLPPYEVRYAINAGTSILESLACLKLAEKYPSFYATVGYHPSDCADMTDREGRAVTEVEAMEALREMLRHPKAVAIGEIGLDYHYDEPEREVQKRWFERQMQLAAETNMPVVIHDREAHGDCLDTVKRYPAVKGVFHSFSGSSEMAKELVKMGYYISFSGVLTFKNARQSVEAMAAIPADRILLETDCPYLTPHPYRGKRNHSGYALLTAVKAAEVKWITVEEMLSIATDNTRRLFFGQEG